MKDKISIAFNTIIPEAAMRKLEDLGKDYEVIYNIGVNAAGTASVLNVQDVHGSLWDFLDVLDLRVNAYNCKLLLDDPIRYNDGYFFRDEDRIGYMSEAEHFEMLAQKRFSDLCRSGKDVYEAMLVIGEEAAASGNAATNNWVSRTLHDRFSISPVIAKKSRIKDACLEKWLHAKNNVLRKYGMLLLKERGISTKYIQKWLDDDNEDLSAYAWRNTLNPKSSVEMIEKALTHKHSAVRDNTWNIVRSRQFLAVDKNVIKRWIKSGNPKFCFNAMRMLEEYTSVRAMFDYHDTEELVSDGCAVSRKAAMLIANEQNVSQDFIKRGLHDVDDSVRASAVRLCQNINLSEEEVQKLFCDPCVYVRANAYLYLPADAVSEPLLKKGLQDENTYVENCAIFACLKRKISLETYAMWRVETGQGFAKDELTRYANYAQIFAQKDYESRHEKCSIKQNIRLIDGDCPIYIVERRSPVKQH